MQYTIRQASNMTGLSEHTLRYYDREGLLPFLERSKSGIRLFSQNDIDWLGLVCCLKNSGMSIDNIKEFMKLCIKGEQACEKKKEILMKHKEHILDQIQLLNRSLSTINYKIEHYKEIGVFHLTANETSSQE